MRVGIQLRLATRVLVGWVGFASAQTSPSAARDMSPSVSPSATATVPLTLEQVLQSTIRAYPLLVAAERDVDAAEGEALSAEGGFDVAWKTKATARPLGYYDGFTVDTLVEKPTSLWGVSTFAGWRVGMNKFPSYDEKLQTLDQGEWRAGVNVPILRNGPIDRRRASLARAELAKQIAHLSLSEQRIELRRAAAYRYFAWVAAGRKLAIAETLLRNVEERGTAIDARVRSGDLPAIEAADNGRALEQRRAQVAHSLRALEQTAIELSLFNRSDAGEPVLPRREQLPAEWPASAVLPEASADAVEVALARRPEPKRLSLQRDQQAVELSFTENQQLPSLDLQVVGSRDFGRALPQRPDLQDPALEVSLVLDIPLQNRVNEGRAATLRAQVDKASIQQRFAAERVTASVQDASSAMRRAEERIRAAEREVALALTLEDAERQRFEAGDSQLLFVNLREQQTAEAELRQVDAIFDYHRAITDWRAARGE